jgi:hypothetical protein
MRRLTSSTCQPASQPAPRRLIKRSSNKLRYWWNVEEILFFRLYTIMAINFLFSMFISFWPVPMSSSLCLFPFNLNVTLILCVSFISDIAIYIYCQCYVCPPLDPTPHSNPFTPEKKKKRPKLRGKARRRSRVWLLRLPKKRANKTSTTFHLKKRSDKNGRAP